MDRKHNEKWGAVNRRDGQTIQWQMRSSKSERWIDSERYNGKWEVVNQRDGQTIQWLMRSSKSERWTDNTMTNEEQ